MRDIDGSNRSRLYELLYLAERQEISPEQFGELQDILRNNPALQQAYLTYIDLSIEVPALVGCRSHRVSEADVALARLELAKETEQGRQVGLPSALSVLSSLRKMHSGNRLWRRIALLTIAASVGFVLVALSWVPEDPFATGVSEKRVPASSDSTQSQDSKDVILTQSAGAVFFREPTPNINSPLQYFHEYSLTHGMAELRFPNGAKVVVTAPAVVEISAADLLLVKIGSCSVHAPPGAEGFRVLTPKAEVIDLGTRFFIGVEDGGETDVHVIEGEAEVRHSDGSGRPKSLAQQQAIRLAGREDVLTQNLSFRGDRYVGDLPDRVVDYQAQPSEGPHVSRLLSVDVQRDGKLQTYQAEELIGIKVVHYAGQKNAFCWMDVKDNSDGDLTSVDRLSSLESDLFLNSGMINPGGAIEPLTSDPVISLDDPRVENGEGLTPGIGFRFNQPVINAAGPDMVLFEVQSVIDPYEGDRFHVSPLEFREGLKSSTIDRFDITMWSAEAKSVATFNLFTTESAPKSLPDFLSLPARHNAPQFRFLAIAVGIDLSDLGYAVGESVDGLFLQDGRESRSAIDPVLIGGLPATADLLETVAP
jgi:hypothetical protein